MTSSPVSPHYVFVDDNSNEIDYQGSWSLTTVTNRNYSLAGLASFPMYGTVHTYKPDDTTLANFTFTFSGTFIEVRFVQSASNDRMVCTVDEESLISTANGCSSPNLDDGRHTLFMGMRPGSLNSHIFDYIRYVPPVNDSAVYPSDPWISIGDEVVKSTKLSDKTAILSPGGTLDFEFTGQDVIAPVTSRSISDVFVGTSMSLYMASVNTDSHISSRGFYSIDGGEHVNVTLDNSATPLTSYIYPQTLIQTPLFPYGKHHFHFSLNAVPEGAEESMPLRGTIIVQNGTMGLEAIPDAMAFLPFAEPSSNTSKRGGIIGGTLAAVFVIALILSYLAILRRRRKLLLTRHFANEEELIHPFFSGRAPQNDNSRQPAEKSSGSLGTALYGTASNSSGTASMRGPRFRVHQDSGEDVVQPGGGMEIVDLPPTYEGIETRRRITAPTPPAEQETAETTVKSPIILSWQTGQ